MNISRQHRHLRVRAKVRGSANRPRISIYRGNRFITAQLIDDEKGTTLLAVHGKGIKAKTKTDQAAQVGSKLAKQAKAAGIKKAVFDRGGYKYHGRVKAVAEGIRAGGLEI